MLDDDDGQLDCGFGVNTAMACLVDYQGQQEFKKIWEQIISEDPEAEDPYEELFADCLLRSYQEHPAFQRNLGEWCNFTIGQTKLNIIMFSSGWGDGIYPSFFGYDESGKICALYIDFMSLITES